MFFLTPLFVFDILEISIATTENIYKVNIQFKSSTSENTLAKPLKYGPDIRTHDEQKESSL